MDSYPYGTLGGHDTEEVFILVFLLVSRYLESRVKALGPLRRSHNGILPAFTDAEVLTVMVVAELQQPPSHRSWYHRLRMEWRALFPKLPDRTRLLRREHALAPVLEDFRRALIVYLRLDEDCERFCDSAPVSLAHTGRAMRNLNKRFRPGWIKDKQGGVKVEVEPGLADIGRCATKMESFFGMKLFAMITMGNIPTSWCLTRGSISDKDTALLDLLEGDPYAQRGGSLRVWTDNGFEYQLLCEEAAQLGHRLFAFPKNRDKRRWPPELRRRIRSLRQRVETTFSKGVRFLNLEHPKVASLPGLMARMAAKFTAMTLYELRPLLPDLAEGRL